LRTTCRVTYTVEIKEVTCPEDLRQSSINFSPCCISLYVCCFSYLVNFLCYSLPDIRLGTARTERFASASRRRAAGGVAFKKKLYAEADAFYRTALDMLRVRSSPKAHGIDVDMDKDAEGEVEKACILNRCHACDKAILLCGDHGGVCGFAMCK
jgi:hypothetical protein